eukprot:CAMPEP_0115014086 /NCGR_PEP_ID=MMETSP0216-20121206/25832_1 /TAXON_ID=223996 /ORGANISM="Protocruzia adherens, Strain Boccale" /LENGTH=104 /DNA_ID=CAMNT_0002383685 /DNA_START=62 /DNA_END=376 /DNA_ORIENTATION=-
MAHPKLGLILCFALVVVSCAQISQDVEPEQDPYAVLGVRPDASLAEVKKAYRREVMKLNPDSHKPDGTQRFHEIIKAYDVLSDSERREVFDQNHVIHSEHSEEN